MPDSQLTITAPLGPGRTATAVVLTPLYELKFALVDNTVVATYGVPLKTQTFDYNGITTITITHSAGGATTATLS